MNGVIVCDSYYGNALRVAETLGEEFRALGHDVTVVNLHQQKLDPRWPPVAGAGFLGVGGPTRMKNMSRRTRSFANKLVTEMKGPLAEDALDSARQLARRFAADELG